MDALIEEIFEIAHTHRTSYMNKMERERAISKITILIIEYMHSRARQCIKKIMRLHMYSVGLKSAIDIIRNEFQIRENLNSK